MSLDSQSLIASSVIGVNLAMVLFFSYMLHSSTMTRSRTLWKLVIIYGLVSTVSVSVLFLSLPTLSVLNLGAEMFYLLVASFVFAIEIPGYLYLMKHDERIVAYLGELRSETVKLGYDFNQYEILKSKSSEGTSTLKE